MANHFPGDWHLLKTTRESFLRFTLMLVLVIWQRPVAIGQMRLVLNLKGHTGFFLRHGKHSIVFLMLCFLTQHAPSDFVKSAAHWINMTSVVPFEI